MSDENVRKHRVEITFDDGMWINLICPDDGCESASACSDCLQSYDAPDYVPCRDCEQPPTGCWIKSWFDGYGARELLTGRVVLPIEASVGEIDGALFQIGRKLDSDPALVKDGDER